MKGDKMMSWQNDGTGRGNDEAVRLGEAVVDCRLVQMRKFIFIWFFLLFVGVGQAGETVTPDERDRDVLEAALLQLTNDKDFGRRGVSTNGVIVLNVRTPLKTGFLRPEQIKGELRTRTVSEELLQAVLKRNSVISQVNSYEAVTAWFTNSTFATNIVVVDLKARSAGRGADKYENLPVNARGWVTSFLPGYSEDGTTALVRAHVGPSAHGAMLTALLEKVEGKWVVKWHRIAFFV
jgi:hypothetical protein